MASPATTMERSILEQILPPELKELLLPPREEMDARAKTAAAKAQQEAGQEAANHVHPCAREVEICAREAGSTSRPAIEACLVKHLDELSASCKCFVHQVVRERGSAPSAASRPAVEPPSVRVVTTSPSAQLLLLPSVTAAAHASVTSVSLHGPPPPHKAHGLTCLLVMTTLFLVAILLIRRICLACCAPKARFAAVVPPETNTTITTVEPLSCAEIKDAPAP